MKKIFLVATIVVSALYTKAQDTLSTDSSAFHQQINPLLYNYTSNSINNLFNENFRSNGNNRINVDFDYSANSDAVPVLLAYKMIFKGTINKALKDRTDSRLRNGVKFEDYMNTGASYRRYMKKWDGTFMLGYHHREARLITGGREAFELLFYGNARFEGDTADMSHINFQNNIYNQYFIGINKVIDYGKYQMQFGISGAFLQGINNQYIQTGNSWIYTATDADSLVFNYDLTFNSAREGAVKSSQLNGAGASVDFNLGFMNKDKWKITLDVFDVGYMTFRKTPVNYSAAKYVVFKGIVIPDLTSFSSQTFDTLNLDSAVRANLPSKSNSKYSIFLPFTAQLVFSKPFLNNKLVLNVGLQYRYLPKYYAYGYAKVNYFLKPDMVVSVSAGAGGYSLFNLGLDFSKSWKYFDFSVGSANLLGLCIPSQMPGASLYLRMASTF